MRLSPATPLRQRLSPIRDAREESGGIEPLGRAYLGFQDRFAPCAAPSMCPDSLPAERLRRGSLWRLSPYLGIRTRATRLLAGKASGSVSTRNPCPFGHPLASNEVQTLSGYTSRVAALGIEPS